VGISSQGEAEVTQVLSGLAERDRIIVYSSAQLTAGARAREQDVVQR
jgi:hypothetical protein